MVWLKFIASLVIILFAGTKLARYGDALSEKTRLGQIWIGLVLLAFITSVPELSTGIGAVTLVSDKALAPDLAIGTIMGSCIFNVLIVAWLDVVYRREPVLSKASPNHMISALMGIILISIAALAIFGGDRISGLALGWLGVPSIAVILVYLIGVRWTLRSARDMQTASPQVSNEQYRDMGMREVWIKFILAGGVVIGSGIWLALIGEEIANTTSLGASFVGSLLLAVSTSMPELALTTAAVRIGAVDLAVADVVGANMINIAKIFIIDIFYTDGSILSSVSRSQITTAIVAIGMSLVVIIGLRFRQRRKTFFVISWYSVLLIALYVYGAYALYNSGIA